VTAVFHLVDQLWLLW